MTPCPTCNNPFPPLSPEALTLMRACKVDERLCAGCAVKVMAGNISGDESPAICTCGSTKDPWFSRTVPMGYFCEDCGGEVKEQDKGG